MTVIDQSRVGVAAWTQMYVCDSSNEQGIEDGPPYLVADLDLWLAPGFLGLDVVGNGLAADHAGRVAPTHGVVRYSPLSRSIPQLKRPRKKQKSPSVQELVETLALGI